MSKIKFEIKSKKFGELSKEFSMDLNDPALLQLPPREYTFLTLYHKDGKSQKEIADMFSITQGAVSSRLRRAEDRLQFISSMPNIGDEEIDKDLNSVFSSLELEIIKSMKKTTCQNETAKYLNEKLKLNGEILTQVKVRHRFEKCLSHLEILKEENPTYLKFYKLLLFIKNNLLKMHSLESHAKRHPITIEELPHGQQT